MPLTDDLPRPDLDMEPLDSDWALLAHAPGAPNGLLLQGWVQGRLQNEDMVGGGQVDAHTAAAHGQQEYRGGRILLECLYCLQCHILWHYCESKISLNNRFGFLRVAHSIIQTHVDPSRTPALLVARNL